MSGVYSMSYYEAASNTSIFSFLLTDHLPRYHRPSVALYFLRVVTSAGTFTYMSSSKWQNHLKYWQNLSPISSCSQQDGQLYTNATSSYTYAEILLHDQLVKRTHGYCSPFSLAAQYCSYSTPDLQHSAFLRGEYGTNLD